MKTHSDRKSGLHPRNRHQAPYDFDALCQRTPSCNPSCSSTSTVPRPWTLPIHCRQGAEQGVAGAALWHCALGSAGRLSLPAHSGAGGLSASGGRSAGRECRQGADRQGVRVLDIGVGANCIYPLLGPANMAGALSAPTSIRCRSRPLPCWPRATGWAARSNAVCRAGPATSFRGLWRRASVCADPLQSSLSCFTGRGEQGNGAQAAQPGQGGDGQAGAQFRRPEGRALVRRGRPPFWPV